MNIHKGFTLLELITVLAIIGILIASSYPLYSQHIIKTRRASAQVALLQLAASLERYRSIHNTYSGATLADAELDSAKGTPYYQLEMKQLSDSAYIVQAVPLGSQTADHQCQTLSLDHLGTKGGAGEGCWE